VPDDEQPMEIVPRENPQEPFDPAENREAA
jgi:hypothetical protein